MEGKKEQLKKELEIIEANERINCFKQDFIDKLKELDKLVKMLNDKNKLGTTKNVNYINYLKVNIYEYINSLKIKVDLLQYALEKKIKE